MPVTSTTLSLVVDRQTGSGHPQAQRPKNRLRARRACHRCPTAAGERGGVDLIVVTTMLAGSIWQSANPPAALVALYKQNPELAVALVDVPPTLRRLISEYNDGLLLKTLGSDRPAEPAAAPRESAAGAWTSVRRVYRLAQPAGAVSRGGDRRPRPGLQGLRERSPLVVSCGRPGRVGRSGVTSAW